MAFPLVQLAVLPPAGWMAAGFIGTVFAIALGAYGVRMMAHGDRGREWKNLLVGEYARRLAGWRQVVAGAGPGARGTAVGEFEAVAA